MPFSISMICKDYWYILVISVIVVKYMNSPLRWCQGGPHSLLVAFVSVLGQSLAVCASSPVPCSPRETCGHTESVILQDFFATKFVVDTVRENSGASKVIVAFCCRPESIYDSEWGVPTWLKLYTKGCLCSKQSVAIFIILVHTPWGRKVAHLHNYDGTTKAKGSDVLCYASALEIKLFTARI